MSGLALSRSVVQREVLEPALEATALNRVQTRLLYDPSPTPDSLIELLLIGLHDGADPWELQALKVARELLLANRQEGGHVLSLTGVIDGWARQLHGDALAGDQRTLSVKQLAAAVRGPLGVLQADQVATLDAVDAVRAIDAATTGCARERLAAGSVRNELGPRKHDLLLELFDRGREAS